MPIYVDFPTKDGVAYKDGDWAWLDEDETWTQVATFKTVKEAQAFLQKYWTIPPEQSFVFFQGEEEDNG